jgi:DNA repair protein RadC
MATRKKPAPALAISALPVTSPHEDAVIRAALAILEARMKAATVCMGSVDEACDFVNLQIGVLDREVFAVMFLNAQHRLIAFDVMFQGTLTQTSVYPREVARRALEHNAAAVVLAHNHPSGEVSPSQADKLLTRNLDQALALVEVRVLDHIIVGGGRSFSFARSGLMEGAHA